MPRNTPNTSSLVPSGNSQLPAEVRLGQAISEFAQKLDSGIRQSFCQLQVQLAQSGPLSPADVVSLTEQLNREGARRHPAWRPAAGTRIGGFLRRIQQFAAFGDILIGGSQNLIASGVWATVRAMLEATICHHVYFDQVSSLLMRLSTSWSITQEFAQHFPGSKELQSLLAEYLIRVVRLCQQVLVFSRRSPAILLAASLFSSFEAEFLPLQQELDQWGLLIEKQFASLTTKAILDGQVAMAKGNRSLSRFISASSRRQILAESQQRLLSSLSPNQDIFDTIFRRERKRGNCAWLLGAPNYKSWKATTSSLLHLHGHLGSGKTVGMANISADLAGQRGGCAFFFCKQEDSRTQNRNSIVGSVLHQLVHNNFNSCAWGTLEDGCRLPMGPVTVDSALKLLPSLLPRSQDYFVLIDGLEECPQIELEDTMQTLSQLLSTFRISLCISERTESRALDMIRACFTSIYSVSLNNPTRDSEIHHYIKSEVQVRNSLRTLPFTPDFESRIVEQLIIGAQGMYLWVALQLEAIFPSHQHIITTNETVIDILGKLPKSLPEAFDQALARISDRRYGMKIFRLVTAAAEPLTGDQLRVALTVEPGNASWEFGKLPHDSRQLVSCCGGSLLEMDEEDGKVRYIHYSILLHLATFPPNHRNLLNLSWLEEAEQSLGSICTTYLSYGIFDTRVATIQNIDGQKVVDSSQEAAKTSSPFLAHLIRHIKGGPRQRSAQTEVNLLSILHQARFGQEDDVVRCFLPYARTYWLQHTRFINAQETSRDFSLWKKIIEEKLDCVELPWDTLQHWSTLMEYALDRAHFCLFQYTMRSRLKFSDLPRFGYLLSLKHQEGHHIRAQWLDDVIARSVTSSFAPDSRFLEVLLKSGASPTFPHAYLPNDNRGLPGSWNVAQNVCEDRRMHSTSIGLPLLQTAVHSLSTKIPEMHQQDLSPGFVEEKISNWFLGLIRHEWVEALEFVLEPSSLAVFRKMGFPPESKLSVLLTRAVEEGRPSVVCSLMKHGAWASPGTREQYGRKAMKSLRGLKHSFSEEVLNADFDVLVGLLPLRDPKPESISNVGAAKLDKMFQILKEGSGVKKVFDFLYSAGFSSFELTKIILWIIDVENYQALCYFLDASNTAGTFISSLPVWDHLLHLTLFKYKPRHRSENNWNQTQIASNASKTSMKEIVIALIARARSHGTLDIGHPMSEFELLGGEAVPRSHKGFTALHYAAAWDLSHGFSPVKLLLEAGSDPNPPRAEHTPLEIALCSDLPRHDIKAIVSDLLQAGADPNRTCANGLTPLHLAVSLTCPGLTHLLVEAGANMQKAAFVSLPEYITKVLEIASLVGSIDGWAQSELQEWGGMVEQSTRTIWAYYYIWRQKHQSRELSSPRDQVGVLGDSEAIYE